MLETQYGYQDFTLAAPVAAGGTLALNVTLEALSSDHLVCYWRPLGEEYGESLTITVTGTSGAYTVTATFPGAAATGSLVRVIRQTPITVNGQLTSFTNGLRLDRDALATAFKQLLFIQQEQLDQLTRAVTSPIVFPAQNPGVTVNDAQPAEAPGGRRILGLGAPTASGDAARLADVVVAQTAQGNLPDPSAMADNTFIIVGTATWQVKTLAQTKAILGLGTAAAVNTGVGAANVPTTAQADGRYCRISNNLSDVTAATARTNLGLGTAATKATGTAAGNVVELDGSARLPAVDGRNLDLSAHSVYGRAGGRLETAAAIRVTTSTALFATASASWAADAATLLPLDSLAAWGEEVYNGSTDIAVDTGTDRFTLKAGKWKIGIEGTFYNQSTGSTYAMALALYDVTAGTHSESLIPVANPANGQRIAQTSGSELSVGLVQRTFIKTLSVDTTFELHAGVTSTAGSNIRVLSLKVIAEKIHD